MKSEKTLEQQLIDAGFVKKSSESRYEHEDGRALYRDTGLTNRWYLRRPGRPAEFLSRYQGEAIAKILGLKWRVMGVR